MHVLNKCGSGFLHMDEQVKLFLSRYDNWDDCPKCWKAFVNSLRLPDHVRDMERVTVINQALEGWAAKYHYRDPKNGTPRAYVSFPSQAEMWAWQITYG